MKLKIFYHSHNKKDGIEPIIEEYLKRLPWKIEFENYCGKKFKTNLFEELKGKYFTIALSENGKEFDSHEFSEYLQKLSVNHGSKLAFVIGPAEGFDKTEVKQANQIISLGKMTFPHNLARLLLVEQMYRAWTILENKPYHK